MLAGFTPLRLTSVHPRAQDKPCPLGAKVPTGDIVRPGVLVSCSCRYKAP